MEKNDFKASLRQTVAIPIIALAILATVILWEIQSLKTSMQLVDRTDQVISTDWQTIKLALDMETGVRGYLATGNSEFLQPYNEAKSIVDSKFDALSRLVSNDPAQQARLAAVRSRFDEWRVYTDHMIELRRSERGGYEISLQDKQLMDSVRAADEVFTKQEEQLRAEREREAHDASRRATVTCVLLSMGVAGFLAIFTRRRVRRLGASFQESLDIAKKRAEELREREEALRSSQAKLQGIIASAMDAIISVDEQQRIVVFNRAAEAVFHCTASEAVGSTLDRFIPETLREVHREHIRSFGSAGVTARSMTSPGLLMAVRSNGEEFPVEATISQVQADGEKIYTVILRDITERKQAEEALRSGEERWAITLQSIGDAVISTDSTGNIDFMNHAAQALTGWSLAEAKGQNLSVVFNIVQEVTRIRPENPVAKVIRLGKVVGLANRIALVRRDGTEIPIEDSGAPIRNREDHTVGVVVVFHDVSDQRKVEKALRNSDRLVTTGRLAATIAHEIHNPLDAVGNLLFLIGQEAAEDATREYVSLARQELARVTQITQQMLAFQREAAKPIPVKIGEILNNVVGLYDSKIRLAGITVNLQIEFDGQLLALPGELRQIFANLVGNAIEAMGSRRGTITLRAHASQDWRRERPGLRVLVADNGPGIPADARASVFEPFFTTKGESGTGLGLWITSDLLRKYDGTMRLRTSTQPQCSGTCFSVFFPIETSPDTLVAP